MKEENNIDELFKLRKEIKDMIIGIINEIGPLHNTAPDTDKRLISLEDKEKVLNRFMNKCNNNKWWNKAVPWVVFLFFVSGIVGYCSYAYSAANDANIKAGNNYERINNISNK